MLSLAKRIPRAFHPGLGLALAMPLLVLGACSDSDNDAVAERPPEKITEGVRDEDHTATKRTVHPPAATGGRIPGEEEDPQAD
ncbi:MAG: hypothetical protein R3D65_03875 [Zhengella sp.]|uniref:hypothetical protein n=1 Tax=Zhengella sp. TaxID=2282762 RepID=UPI001DA0587A|nr:hypothetical protein [Notoacmeibacter sp.]MCC0026120.1 hypothetical protein [Brucellaceae bacterium]